MEPIITYEGYEVLQNAQKSRDLLSDYYKNLGFQVVSPGVSKPADTAAVKQEDKTAAK